MPNSKNYKQNISDLRPQETGNKTIRRTLTDEQYVIKEETSGLSNYNLDVLGDRERIEMHFYVPNTNNLIYSVELPLSEYFRITDQNQSDNKVDGQFIFWTPGAQNQELPFQNENSFQVKYLSELPTGTYDVIINFFVNEVGTYDDENWRIKRISNSKRELILHAGLETITDNQYLDFTQFTQKSIFFNDFIHIWEDTANPSKETSKFVESSSLTLNAEQTEKTGSINLGDGSWWNSAGGETDYEKITYHLFDHIYESVKQFMDSEQGQDKYRIEYDSYNSYVDEKINELIDEHIGTEGSYKNLAKININDSGPIPFLVNE